MQRADYHLHTEYSMDCQMSVDALCRAAIAAGLTEICITDHTEFGHPEPGCDIPPNMPSLLSDIEAARVRFPSLTIRAGIEIGDNPLCRDRIRNWLDEQPLDFRLLSLHLVDSEDPFFQTLFSHTTQHSFYRRYVESKLESVLAWAPAEYDAIAHLGYCVKFAPYPVESRALRYAHAPDAFDSLFATLAHDGKALEINTSGFQRIGEFIPDRELLTRFSALGGEFVTIASDAHNPKTVGAYNDEARALAKSCGLRYMLTFAQRVAIPVAL